MTTNRTKSVTAFEEVYINRPPTHPTPTTKTMSTPTNSGSKAKSEKKRFTDRFAVDCALLQERTKGIKKKDQKKKKKIATVDLNIKKTNDKTSESRMEIQMENKDVENQDLQHHNTILQAKIDRLEEQQLHDKITISNLKDRIKDMEEADKQKRNKEFPSIRIVRVLTDDREDCVCEDMLDEFRMPEHIFKEMPLNWQSFVKQQIAMEKKSEHMHCLDFGEHFERMMTLDEHDDVWDEDVEKALTTFDKMWDYGEEDENGERDYAYREENWEDGVDFSVFVYWEPPTKHTPPNKKYP